MSDLNDPRVLFAAERTALAWSRTSLTLMALGFAIERFGLFIKVLSLQQGTIIEDRESLWIALICLLMAAIFSTTAILQYKNTLKTIRPIEIPAGHNVYLAVALNALVAALAVTMAFYMFYIRR